MVTTYLVLGASFRDDMVTTERRPFPSPPSLSLFSRSFHRLRFANNHDRLAPCHRRGPSRLSTSLHHFQRCDKGSFTVRVIPTAVESRPLPLFCPTVHHQPFAPFILAQHKVSQDAEPQNSILHDLSDHFVSSVSLLHTAKGCAPLSPTAC